MTDEQERLDGDTRPPPNNLEIEQMLLGALLVNNEAYFKVTDLQEEHFYEPVHGRIFKAIVNAISKNEVADPMRLKNQFENDEDLTESGGAGYLIKLVGGAVTIVTVPDYAKSIIKDYTRRQIMQFSEQAHTEALNNAELDPSEFLNEMEEALHELRPDGEKEDTKPVDARTMFDDTMQTIDDAHNNPGLVGVTTGLHWLDERIGGFRPSRLYILAGRPGMGKTALAVHMAKRAAEIGKGVLFFSLEMAKKELGIRILTSAAAATDENIHYSLAGKGKLGQDQRAVLADVAMMQRELPLHTIDKAGLKLSQIRLWAMRHKRNVEKKGKTLDVIFIDYLQIMQPDSRYRGNKVQEVSEMSMGLKNLSKELNVPVVCLSQLSRQVEQRENKRPLLSDLRDSGSIEQDADVVLFVYRDAYYLEKENPPIGTQKYDQLEKSLNKIEVITSKQRDGANGTDYFWADMATNYFRELKDHEKPNN